MKEIEETIVERAFPPKLSRRETARRRRETHENAHYMVQNVCTLGMSQHSIISPPISPVSLVGKHRIGNAERVGSIPTPGTTMKTTARGALSEAEVMLTLARLGATVFTPAIGHDHPFDIIAHWGRKLSRVQIKTMRDDDSGSIVMAGSSVVDRRGGKQWPVITAQDCDVIVGWYPTESRAYVIAPRGKTLYTFRREPPRNNQVVGIFFEQDFRLTHLDQLLPETAEASGCP